MYLFSKKKNCIFSTCELSRKTPFSLSKVDRLSRLKYKNMTLILDSDAHKKEGVTCPFYILSPLCYPTKG